MSDYIDDLRVGHASITGTGTISTGLQNPVTSVLCSVAAPSSTALSGFVAGAVAGTNPGDINITVVDKTGATATAAAVVNWFASSV